MPSTSRSCLHLLSVVPKLQNAIRNVCPHIRTVDLLPKIQSGAATKELEDAKMLLADPDLIANHNVLNQTPKLEWIQSTWHGVDIILNSLDLSKGSPDFKLSKLGGLDAGNRISQYVLGQVIAHEQRFYKAQKSAQEKYFWSYVEGLFDYRSLDELKIGILGLGSVGQQVAVTCKKNGMTVWGVRRSAISSCLKSVDFYRHPRDLLEVFQCCDYIVNALPSTGQTRHLITEDLLTQLHGKTVFINVGRGDVVNEEVILRALNQGWLKHAILDVFEKEPLPATSSLWSHPRITMTPHIAGNTTALPIAKWFCCNLLKFEEGEALSREVDWTKEV